jgi:hypothetical protein
MIVALVIVPLSACGHDEGSTAVTSGTAPSRRSLPAPAQEPLAPEAPEAPESSAKPPKSAALPQGRVPEVTVGTWTGGEGSKTGEKLTIRPDGSYARIDRDGVVYRKGVIVAEDTDFVTYDLDGVREPGSWDYTNAAGIEVLGVYFGPYYYSYTRS